jgi:hypothetical protein
MAPPEAHPGCRGVERDVAQDEFRSHAWCGRYGMVAWTRASLYLPRANVRCAEVVSVLARGERGRGWAGWVRSAVGPPGAAPRGPREASDRSSRPSRWPRGSGAGRRLRPGREARSRAPPPWLASARNGSGSDPRWDPIGRRRRRSAPRRAVRVARSPARSPSVSRSRAHRLVRRSPFDVERVGVGSGQPRPRERVATVIGHGFSGLRSLAQGPAPGRRSQVEAEGHQDPLAADRASVGSRILHRVSMRALDGCSAGGRSPRPAVSLTHRSRVPNTGPCARPLA